MGILNIPRIPRGASIEEVINIYNMAIDEMEHRVNGFLQTNNIQEVGNWLVKQNILVSKDGDVGMSTEDTGGDDVRFFAGGSDKENAPWQVRKSGKGKATGWTIESQNGYPKIVIDADDNLLAIYTDANTYMKIEPGITGAPTIEIYEAGTIRGALGTTFGLPFFHGYVNTTVSSEENLNLKAGSGDFVQVDGWSAFYSAAEAQTLATALNNLAAAIATKAAVGASTSSNGSFSLNGGIPIGTKLATSSDGINVDGNVTWAGISQSAHSHTQT